MQKGLILLIVSVFFLGSFSQDQPKYKKLQEFAFDLSSVNKKIRGQLKLSDDFNGDLTKLTFVKYLECLQEMENTSSEGVTEIIQKADKHIFATSKVSFIIGIYSKELNVVLYDDANTDIIDSVKVLFENEIAPDLHEFISKTGYIEKTD
jgi:hypothetical protein